MSYAENKVLWKLRLQPTMLADAASLEWRYVIGGSRWDRQTL